jgi:cell shape-determining protein MreD
MSDRNEYIIYFTIAFVMSFFYFGIVTYAYHAIINHNPHFYWYQALIPALILAFILPLLKLKGDKFFHIKH